MNLSQFLSVLRARWKIAATIFWLVVLTAVGISLALPKQYISTATVIVDQMRPDPVAATMYPGNPSPAFMATQVDVIKSDRVAMNVIRKLKLADSESAKEQWERVANKGDGATIETWLMQQIQFALDVKPSRESNVISVAYKADDSERAAKMANAFVQAYLNVSLELKTDPARVYGDFFDKRAKELRQAVEDAQAKLSAYQRDKGVIIASDGQLDAESARLNELSTALVAVQAAAADGRVSSLDAGAQTNSVINNPNLAVLRADLTRAESRLQELSSRLGDNHPQVIEARATINTLRARLNDETRRVSGGVVNAASANRAREVELRAQLEAQRTRVMKMRIAREEGGVLVRDLESAQRAYEAVQTRASQSKLEGQATQSPANVLAEATPPLLPASPKIVLNTVLSIVLGAVLGIGAAIMLEMFDRRVRSVEEVSELLGVPILGVLPKPAGALGFSGGRVALASPRGLFGQLPAPRKEA